MRLRCGVPTAPPASAIGRCLGHRPPSVRRSAGDLDHALRPAARADPRCIARLVDGRPAVNVSVAMATYMGSAYIIEQLSSILEQSTPPAEIVVCDDCSSDGTVPLISEFARRSPVPIRVFVNDERVGWRANFMRAASLCESELIAFCDQDDVWDRRKLELITAAFADAETLMVFHDATIVGADLRPIVPFLQGDGESDRAGALERSPWRDVYGFTIAFRSALLDFWTYWPSSVDKSVGHQRAAHDQWLLFLANSLGTTRHLPEPLALYRQHDHNAVSAKDTLRPTSRLSLFLDQRGLVNSRLVVLDSRIRTLRAIARDHEGFRGAAARAVKTHVVSRTRTASQATIYNSNSVLRRLRSYASLIAGGAYSGDVWALGRLAVVHDGAAAILGPTPLARVYAWEARRSAASRAGTPEKR